MKLSRSVETLTQACIAIGTVFLTVCGCAMMAVIIKGCICALLNIDPGQGWE